MSLLHYPANTSRAAVELTLESKNGLRLLFCQGLEAFQRKWVHSDLGAPKQRRPPTVHRHLERRDNRLNNHAVLVFKGREPEIHAEATAFYLQIASYVL